MQTLLSISAFHQKAPVKWLWLIYSVVKLRATKEDSNFFKFKCMKCFLCRLCEGKQITCKEVEIQKAICMFMSQLRSSFSSFKGTRGVPGHWCFKMFDVKVAKREGWWWWVGGWVGGGGRGVVGCVCYTFNKVLPHESRREMQACNLVTEQWSERFMAGY